MEITKIKVNPEKLKHFRGNARLVDVAKDLGIRRNLLWNYENGVVLPSSNILARLLIYYGKSIEEVVEKSEKILTG